MARKLRALGFEAYALKGGLRAWEEAQPASLSPAPE